MEQLSAQHPPTSKENQVLSPETEFLLIQRRQTTGAPSSRESVVLETAPSQTVDPSSTRKPPGNNSRQRDAAWSCVNPTKRFVQSASQTSSPRKVSIKRKRGSDLEVDIAEDSGLARPSKRAMIAITPSSTPAHPHEDPSPPPSKLAHTIPNLAATSFSSRPSISAAPSPVVPSFGSSVSESPEWAKTPATASPVFTQSHLTASGQNTRGAVLLMGGMRAGLKNFIPVERPQDPAPPNRSVPTRNPLVESEPKVIRRRMIGEFPGAPDAIPTQSGGPVIDAGPSWLTIGTFVIATIFGLARQ